MKYYKKFSNQIEISLLSLALLAILSYLINLLGIFKQNNLSDIYESFTLVVDLIFVFDFLIKIFVYRSHYFKGPWWFIDLIATLPILASLGAQFNLFESLRITRTVRYFYILRILRIVRLTKLFKYMQFESNKDEIESKQFKHTIWFCSVLLTGFLVLSINQIHSSYPLENANIVEFYLILGLLTSVIICFLIVRVQIPEVTRSEIKKLLNIALPRQVASSFISNPKLMHETIEMPATIIFCDLNNFTSVVEELDGNHEKLQSYLQESLGIICEEHSKQNLIIDKFMGDCVMSFKGGNLVNGTPAEHALSVVKATLNSKSVLNKSKLSYFNDVQIGGASTDSALIGAFGTEKRLSYTVLGDAVNLASRLESASKKCGVSNLFCEKTKRLTDGNKYFIWREVGYLLVTGKKQVVKAFEALEKNKDNQNLIDSFHHALNEYKLKNFEKAKNLFEKTINLVSSSDKLSEKYLQNCNSLLKNGIPIDWEPTIVVSK